MHPFVVKEPNVNRVPIIISVPHCGTEIPDDLIHDYVPEQVGHLDDTDWFLQDLNDFALDLGITMIHAKYHRWVIDLNRDPESAPLYNDGRIITGLCSTTDFLGNPIYKDGCEPTEAEIDRRLEQYYWPYYQQIEAMIFELQEQFGEVLLWDAHSIRHLVPTIQENPFPEMILGSNDGLSAREELINVARTVLSATYELSYNTPFKGGHITRYFGDPDRGINALQLERNKNLYMDDTEREYHEGRAGEMQKVLQVMFERMIFELT